MPSNRKPSAQPYDIHARCNGSEDCSPDTVLLRNRSGEWVSASEYDELSSWADDRINTLESDIITLESKIRDLERDLDSANTQNDNLQTEYDDLSSVYSSLVDHFGFIGPGAYSISTAQFRAQRPLLRWNNLFDALTGAPPNDTTSTFLSSESVALNPSLPVPDTLPPELLAHIPPEPAP